MSKIQTLTKLRDKLQDLSKPQIEPFDRATQFARDTTNMNVIRSDVRKLLATVSTIVDQKIAEIDKREQKMLDLMTAKPTVKVDLGGSALKGEKGERGERGIAGKDGRNGRDGKDGRNGKDGVGKTGKQGKAGIDGKDGVDGEDGSPDTPEEIVSKINSLSEGSPSKIHASHITGLSAFAVGSSSRRKGLIVKQGRADLSTQCDGSNKTFTFSEGYREGTVQIFSTQFPIIYRPVVDFTEDGSGVVLTSEVGAPASGQTLVALYEKS